MLDTHPDAPPRSEVSESAVRYVGQLREAGQPIVLTLNGKAELVVHDATSYQMLVELVDRLETIEAIREGIESVDLGEGRPAEEVFKEIRRKHNLPRKR